ncbi:E1 protein [Eumops bonariensis papillomavirus type 2]|nr:E1 protein [Eumops bonariensis papillomavirus type 2]
MADKGTDGEWFIVREADVEGDDSIEELFDADTDSDVSNLIDDSEQSQGNSSELLQQQESAESSRQEQCIKRKLLLTPEQEKDLENLSPRLNAVQLSPRQSTVAKKRLFSDSGLESSLNEAPSTSGAQVVVDVNAILKSSNRKATMLSKFKALLGCSYNDLTRPYHSPKTMGQHWVIFFCGCYPPLLEGGQTLVLEHCQFLLYHNLQCGVLMLCVFKRQKCRDTICGLMKSIFNINEALILCDPPRLSVPAALYWFKLGIGGYSNTFISGPLPDWVGQRTLVNQQMQNEKPFVLKDMVQWAYDNGHHTECAIAYNYATIAEEEPNAMAFINSNNQAKIVRDCAFMVKQYVRAEMQAATISQWVHRRAKKIQDGGNWREIVRFLKYQNVNMLSFENALKNFLKAAPKKCCIVIYGPSDCGKSYFASSLMKFLGGRVLSFLNSTSHFWLSPLADCKCALIDDATTATWNYIDTYLRSALDGSAISIDLKNRQPLEILCPPLLITTNIDITEEDKYKFLRSRLTFLHFDEVIPFDADGNPVHCLNEQNWKQYFQKFWGSLDLSDQEDEEGDDESPGPFRRSGK